MMIMTMGEKSQHQSGARRMRNPPGAGDRFDVRRSAASRSGSRAAFPRRHFLKLSLAAPGALAAGTMAVTSALAALQPRAPNFVGIDGWINSGPISLADPPSPATLVCFWTYSCINSRRPMRYLKRWREQYGPQGLRVIGIHTPEFQFEHERANVETYVREEGILFPVGLDNEYRTWDAFGNDAWPAFYLISRDARVALVRAGEGYAHEIEGAIRNALGLAPTGWAIDPGDDPDLSRIGSPEAYFGAEHPTPQDPRQSPRIGTAEYSFAQGAGPALDRYLLDGSWAREGQRLTLVSPKGGLRYRFSAAKMHLVASAAPHATIRIRVDGKESQPMEVDWPTLYTVVDGSSYREQLLEVTVDTPGLVLFSATFG
jgi:hypothetical protein